MGLRCLVTERAADGRRELRRGFSIERGERILLVDDVMTTGGSVAETVRAVVGAGGRVAGASVLVDRSGGAAEAGTQYFAAHSVNVEAFQPEPCPLCRTDVPMTNRVRSPA